LHRLFGSSTERGVERVRAAFGDALSVFGLLASAPSLIEPEEDAMATITLKGNPIHTVGELPKPGSEAPPFTLTKDDLTNVGLDAFAGKNVVLNIFPSIDTGVCAASVRQFNKQASELPNTTIVGVSKDLPFALKRFCGAEGIDKVVTASAFRDDRFGSNYGVLMTDGPLAGLFSRAIVVIDAKGRVVHTEQVPEIAQEPNYAAAIDAIRRLG
jgi:thiol peroxidase